MIHEIKTADHPEAAPRAGEQAFRVLVPHENGDDYVELQMGAKGYRALALMIRQMGCDIEYII